MIIGVGISWPHFESRVNSILYLARIVARRPKPAPLNRVSNYRKRVQALVEQDKLMNEIWIFYPNLFRSRRVESGSHLSRFSLIDRGYMEGVEKVSRCFFPPPNYLSTLTTIDHPLGTRYFFSFFSSLRAFFFPSSFLPFSSIRGKIPRFH